MANVARMTSAYNFFIGKPKKNNHLGNLAVGTVKKEGKAIPVTGRGGP
jgi:hypothetical protein